MLQGPGGGVGAVGPALHSHVQEEVDERGVGGALGDEEEAEGDDPEG